MIKIKAYTLIKYFIFIVICSIAVSSCCKKYTTDDDTSYNNISNKNKIYTNRKLSSNNETMKTQIQQLKDINIIYFDLNKYNILIQYIDVLNKHADFLRKNPYYKIIIEGHTDERGTPEYNIALGERRATSIKIYLQSQGVIENQISLISYGKEQPAFLGHSEKYYAKNRRAVLIY